MFKIEKIRPLFTGVVTTAKKYVGDVKTESGLIISMDGQLNPYQTVISVGNMVHDVKEGDIVKLNFKRYALAKHVPGAIDKDNNLQADDMKMAYELPILTLNGETVLFMQNNDIEYVVEKYTVDEGGLLQ